LESQTIVDKQKLIDLFSQCKHQAQKVQGIATKLNNNSVSLLRVGELLYPEKVRREATKLEERAGICLTSIVATSLKLAEAILNERIVHVCDNMFVYISTRIGKFLWRNRRIVFGISTPIVALGTAATMTMWLSTLPIDTGIMALIGELIPLAPLTIGSAVIAPPAIFLGILAGLGVTLIIGGAWFLYSRNKRHTVSTFPNCLDDLAKEAEDSLSNLLAYIQPVHLSDSDLSQTNTEANANRSTTSVVVPITSHRKKVTPSPIPSSASSSTANTTDSGSSPNPKSKVKSRKSIETPNFSSGSSVEGSHAPRRSLEVKPNSRRNSVEPEREIVDKRLYEEIPPVLAQ